MTNKLRYILFAALALVLAACGSDSDEPVPTDYLSVSADSIGFYSKGGTYAIDVASEYEWSVVVGGENTSWLQVTTTGTVEKRGKIALVVDSNKTTQKRSASLVVQSKSKRKVISVSQGAPLAVSATAVYLGSKSNLETTVDVAGDGWSSIVESLDWVNFSFTSSAIKISAKENTSAEPRSTRITITKDGEPSIYVSVQQSGASGTDEPEPDTPSGYRLVWSDEFDSALGTDWTHETHNAGWRNNELQAYVAGVAPDGQRVSSVADGALSVRCVKGRDGHYYSARLVAKPTVGWTYGYFEMRAKLPVGKGVHSMFALTPCNATVAWPKCGEADIVEHQGNSTSVSSTILCSRYNFGGTAMETASKRVADCGSEYHVYACEWTSTLLRFLVDGEVVFTYRNDGKNNAETWPFGVAFSPTLCLAYGGDWSITDGVDDTSLPQAMVVDYVRVYQKN